MPRKTYLRPQNDDYAPDNNIQLGHVWRDPRDPGTFIGAPIPIPDDIKINHNHKGSGSIDLGHELHGNVGLWAKLAELPINAYVRIRWNHAEDGSYNIPTMDTYSIEPTPKYVEESVKAASSEMLRRGSNLFMVTGVKIARGGEGSNNETMTFGVDNEAGVGTGAASVPVQVGEQASYSRSRHNNQQFGSTGDFVFAYRVREIYYKRGVLDTKEYRKGAVLGDNLISIDQSKKTESTFVLEEAELDEDDVEVDGEIILFVDDNGEECQIVI